MNALFKKTLITEKYYVRLRFDGPNPNPRNYSLLSSEGINILIPNILSSEASISEMFYKDEEKNVSA